MARDLNGTSDCIDFALKASQIGLPQVTYSFWAFYDSVAQFRTTLRRNDSTAQDFRFEFDDGIGLAIVVPWTGVGLWSPPKPASGQWVNIIISYDYGATTNVPTAYYDNVAQTVDTDITPTGSSTNDATNLRIGATFTPNEFMDGRIAELGIWPRILNSQERTALAAGYSPLFIINPIFYCKFLGGFSYEPDIIGGAIGTLSGTTIVAHPPGIIYPHQLGMTGAGT